MKDFKVGDRVRAVKDFSQGHFKKGWEGKVIKWEGKVTKPDCTYFPTIEVLFDNGQRLWAFPDEIELIEDKRTHTLSDIANIANNAAHPDEIELIEPTLKPFPEIEQAIDDLNMHLKGVNTEQFKAIYNYFAQFQYEKTVEVFPEVNKVYEFSMDGKDWQQAMLISYAIRGLFEHNYALYIRPIQPTRLEQLKSKHPNLSNDELIELLDILLTQMRE